MMPRCALLAALAACSFAANPDGAALFNSHCAACHRDHADGRAPSRGEVAVMPPEAVANALLQGHMTTQAAGLSQEEGRAIASYVTGKPVSLATVRGPTNHCTVNKSFDPGSGDWNGWGVDRTNSRFQPQPGFAAADVPKLRLKWAFGFPGDAIAVAQPALVGGRVFVG